MINFKITDLQSSPSLNIREDFLMISRQNDNGIYSSYKIHPSELIDSFEGKFENLDDVTIFGTWTFDSLFVSDLKSDLSGPTSVINMKYAYNTFMDKLNALSSEIYNGPHIPSHVDEIIYSTTLKTLEKVQKIYGTNTQWEQINGRFLMASNSNIGKLAGAASAKVTINNIPEHRHGITLDNTPKTISLNEMKEYDAGEIAKAADLKADPLLTIGNIGLAIWFNRGLANDFGIKGDEEEGEVAEYKGRATRTIGIDGSYTISENSGGSEGHNNIPPFYSVYIWRRTR